LCDRRQEWHASDGVVEDERSTLVAHRGRLVEPECFERHRVIDSEIRGDLERDVDRCYVRLVRWSAEAEDRVGGESV